MQTDDFPTTEAKFRAMFPEHRMEHEARDLWNDDTAKWTTPDCYMCSGCGRSFQMNDYGESYASDTHLCDWTDSELDDYITKVRQYDTGSDCPICDHPVYEYQEFVLWYDDPNAFIGIPVHKECAS